MKKLLIPAILISMITTAHAGLAGRTQHSRANCGNNETITWWLGHSAMYWTSSNHYRYGVFQHSTVAGWENTWRSAAVHWGEATPGSGWMVDGYHWTADEYRNSIFIEETVVNDCSIYDGWWDH